MATKQSISLEWMHDLCDKSEDIFDRHKPLVSEPWTVQYNGSVYRLATNGHVLAMLEGDADFAPMQEKAWLAAKAIVDEAFKAKSVTTASILGLKAWCTGIELDRDCNYCGGTGEIFCMHCDRDGAVYPECGGAGHRTKTKPGNLCGVILDKSKLWRAIRNLNDGTVEICPGKLKVSIRGHKLAVVVSGMRPEDARPTSDVFPCELLNQAGVIGGGDG